MKRLPMNWDELKHELDDRLAVLRKEEASTLKMAARAILVSREMLQLLQESLMMYTFEPGEEVTFYKDIKPFFLSRVIYFNRLYDFEMQRSMTSPARLENLINLQLDRMEETYVRNGFIYRYLKSGSTFFDDKLFFHSAHEGATAIYELDIPVESGIQICYDHVVAHLLASDLMRKYMEQLLEDQRQAGGQAAHQLRIVWTDSKTALIELVYAWHAAGVFNNGKIDLKDVVEFVEKSFHVDLGHYPRTFQEILARKKGYTNALDRWRDKLLLRIQKIEEKYDRY